MEQCGQMALLQGGQWAGGFWSLQKGMVLALTDKDVGVTGTTMRDRPWGYRHHLWYSLSG